MAFHQMLSKSKNTHYMCIMEINLWSIKKKKRKSAKIVESKLPKHLFPPKKNMMNLLFRLSVLSLMMSKFVSHENIPKLMIASKQTIFDSFSNTIKLIMLESGATKIHNKLTLGMNM